MAPSTLIAAIFLVMYLTCLTSLASHASGQSTSSNTIRLVNGSNDLQGRVEVLIDGIWGTVCDDYWNLNDAHVVCRQLGYVRGLSATGSAQFGRGTIPIVLDDVKCKGSEKQLQDCPANRENNCNHGEDAGVKCTTITSSEIVLVGGSSEEEGRVEVFVNNAWGTVCGDDWDLTDATVVCRQLGYNYAVSAFGWAHFGEGKGEIALENVNCSGQESRLQDCRSSPYKYMYHCGHWRDAGVICTGGLGTSDVRLAGDNSSVHGRVEVFINGVWGTVCDDDWDLNDARVVCRQLGFVDALSAVGSAEFGQGSGDVFLDNLACDGTERTLLDCPRAARPYCRHSRDAGVICLRATEHSGMRLVGGSSALEGRVEVKFGNLWGTICDDDWDLADATVVCRQLGYGEALSAPGGATFGEGTGLIAMDEVDCKGTEDNLSDCAYHAMEDCQHSEDAGVSCSGMQPAYKFGQVRLVDGSSEYEGYVEVNYNRQWGTVCDVGWDKLDADVVCEELGFDFAIFTSESRDYNRSAGGPVWLSNVRCSGTEDRLAKCYHGKWDDNYCSHAQDVWVKCNSAPSTSTSLTTAAIVGIAVGSFVALILCIFCSYWFCRSSKNTTTASPAASRTTYSQVPANEANTATPVIHYHTAQQSVSVAPSIGTQPSATRYPANETPPPSYETTVAQPTVSP
ncbi:deleted in malignant brain tumors 1 protein-like isoform X2 [Acanthaster planci]|uniref:Deleted in malignant brain tumors 1 protein-like isoform X2 n=1 Tax=Acanthaster planci TaxID=133434 RepID=A0A8B7YKK6_ACAPL|nr:deleted in malignant brain tumors 1 protein-like isoform X2 [Acanthaster planci]